MSNVRPWFRLSSIARPTSQGSSDPPPPPPPQTRPTPRRPVIVRPTVRQPSPPRQQQPPSSPPRQQKQSPTPPPPSRHMSPPTPPKATIPPPPTRSSYTPPPSPKEVQEALPRKPHSPPSPAHSARSSSSESSVKTRSVTSESETHRKAPLPRVVSPYSLPPSQLHTERETTQKNILTAEKTNQVHDPNHHNQNYHQSNMTKKMHRQPFSDSESIMGTRVITIAGENKGAVMEILRSPPNKIGGTGTHTSRLLHGEKGKKLQSSSSSSSSDEGEGKKKATKNHNIGPSNLPVKAYMNSNVQMINNSLVYNSKASHHDPGVHLRISRRSGSDNGFHINDYGNTGGYTD